MDLRCDCLLYVQSILLPNFVCIISDMLTTNPQDMKAKIIGNRDRRETLLLGKTSQSRVISVVQNRVE